MSSSNALGAARVPPMHWCHECRVEMRPLMTPMPTCPRCNSGFVEEIDSSSNPRLEEGDEDDDAMQVIFGRPSAEADESSTAQTDSTPNAPMDFGSLVGGLLRGLATAGSQPRTERASPSPGPNTDHSSRSQAQSSDNSNPAGPNFRSGTSQFGGVNFTWGMGSYNHTTQNGEGSSATNTDIPFGNRQPPIGLNEFVRRSFQTSDLPPDDGMGGAGAAADGRFFNHDNERNRGRSSSQDDQGDAENNGYPPELASLRDLFSNLLGGLGEGPANMFADIFGSGRTGDYVFNQQGLDDVITQLMDQTRGSTAPPPASEEAIAELPRFSRFDKAKVKQARNRECSTCMDTFLEDVEESNEEKAEPSLDSNQLSSTIADAAGASADEDPPETIPGEEDQQDELMMMPCKHLFHLDCLLPWLKTNGTCPVCRVSLEKLKTKEEPSSSSNSNTNTSAQASQSASSSHATTSTMDVDNEDDETPQMMRERSRRAAEARINGSNQPTQSIPGSFLQPDELD